MTLIFDSFLNYFSIVFGFYSVDECFEKISEKLLKTADAMKKRLHLLQLRPMQVSLQLKVACLNDNFNEFL